MAKTWSINTTVRNPDRIKGFLTQMQKLEGNPFNEKNQEEFFKLQIKHHLYNPTRRTLGNEKLVEEVSNEDEEVSDEALERIIDIYRVKSVDAAARGRTAAGVLNRYGLTVAAKSKGKVKLTDPARKWLKEEISDRELFLKLLLKWQYPNPIEDGYSNFNIKPFVGVLHLINKVNKKWSKIGNNSVGISKKEFALFGITLKNYQEIDNVVEELIAFRQKSQNLSGQERKEFRNTFIKKKLKKVFNSTNQTKWNNLRDYADCAIHYFRITEFVYLRGKNNYIDLAPSYLIQINKLLASDNASAKDFENYEKYLEYLEDLSLPTLPWENLDDLLTIKQELINDIHQLSTEVKKPQIEQQLKELPTTENIYQLKEQINFLEDIYNDLKIKRLSKYKYNYEELEKFVDGISNATASNPTKIVTTRPSLDLEWFTSLSLMVLNDAEEIKPSYKLGDDGIPTGFRPSISDIECYYQNFNLAVEVTNQRGRQQWMSEAQPVMRHFRDFEEKSTKKRNYCLFIAPHIHRDTLNYFWTAIKYEYEGQPQKIVPLTTNQFLRILEFARKQFGKGNLLKHKDYQELFDTFFQKNILETNSQDWIDKFDKLISFWQEKIKAKYNEN
jgi:hypothetical protein